MRIRSLKRKWTQRSCPRRVHPTGERLRECACDLDAEHLRKLVRLSRRRSIRACWKSPLTGARRDGVCGGCREVVGIDLTDAPLKIAEKMRAERGLSNVSFQKGDVESRCRQGR